VTILEYLIHNPLTRFLAQAVTVIVASRLLGLLAKRIGQPLVVAEVVAGILLGPSLMGLVWPEASAILFAEDARQLLNVVSQVGLVLFMFLVGLELDLHMLRSRGRSALIISQASIVVPFVLGLLLATYLYPRYADGKVTFTAFALFLGTAMSITALPVLARILAERRLLRTRVGAQTIACAAINDVTAWCMLAFVVAVARADGVADAVRTTVLAVAYIAAMALLVRPLLQRLAARVATPEALTQNVVASIIVLVFLSGWTTEIIGIHALFGAFLLGAIFPKEGGLARALTERLEDVVLIVLLPLFFAYSGLSTHIGLLNKPEDWAVCAVVIIVACVGKFCGSALPARWTGLSWREASALGVLMNTRGLMELIVLNIGLELGVISPTIFTMLVLMALVTTLITTPILKRVYPDEVMARELLDTVEQPAAVPVKGYRVLVCTAYASSGPGLVTLASALAGKGAGQIYALHLKHPEERQSDLIGAPDPTESNEVLEPLLRRAQELQTDVCPLSFVSPRPASDICQVAAAREADLVLLGAHKPLLSQVHLGGVVHDVMSAAPADVGVFVERGLTQIKNILVPFQGSAHDRAALGLARRLMKSLGAHVIVLHIVRPERKGASAMVQTVFGEEHGQVTFDLVEHTDPAAAVLERSRKDIDLVVVGLGTEWGLTERRYGIQPEKLIHECPVSLLIVRDYSAPEVAVSGSPEART